MKNIVITFVLAVFGGFSVTHTSAQIQKAPMFVKPANKAVVVKSGPEEKNPRKIEVMTIKPIGNYEASWKNADGTVLRQTFKLKDIAMRPMNNNNAPKNGSRLKTFTKSSTPEDDGQGWRCLTEDKKVTMNDNSFMTVDYSQQASHIYPGAIYKFDNYVNGSWKGEEYNRNPIRINAIVYNTSGKNYEDINEPGAATIGNGIATLFRGFSKNPDEIASGSMSFTAYEVESMSDAMVKIGASGYGFGFYAKNLFQFNDKEHHKYIMIDCTKEMFTINTSIPQNGFFNNPSYESNDMMFINSVTYGVRILACMDIITRERTIADKFEGGGSWGLAGGQVDVDVLSRELNSTSTIKMYVVGGKSSEVYPVYSIDDLKKRCAKIAETTNYNTVMPIKYQFKNLKDEVVISNSATDYFITRSCSYQAPGEPEKDLEVTANISSMKTLNNNTDAELYGQIWAQVFDGNGKEVLPANNKDRLFAIDQQAHLNATQLQAFYKPNIEAKFKIPANAKKGARMIIYYWLMEYDNIGSDDFLHMQNSYQLPYSRNKNEKYYVTEVQLDEVPTSYSGTSKTANFTASGEGVFEVNTNISKKDIK